MHGIRALRLYTYISKGASERRMLLCWLMEKMFLKNSSAKEGLFMEITWYQKYGRRHRQDRAECNNFHSGTYPPVRRKCVRRDGQRGDA